MAEDIANENIIDEMMGDQGEIPTREKLLEMLENANMTDDMKDKMRSMLTGGAPQVFGTGGGTLLGVLFVFVIFSILFFFGYKLYKSIKEKELKKEEKKKLKQMKKKK